MANMRVFQIQKGEILIINGDKQYSDTVENFKLDSGLSLDNINEVIYDNYQECSVINKEFKDYPNTEFEGYIDNVDIYIKAKSEREYVPPKEPTEEEKLLNKINEIMAANDEQIADIKDAMLVAVLTDDTELQSELKKSMLLLLKIQIISFRR